LKEFHYVVVYDSVFESYVQYEKKSVSYYAQCYHTGCFLSKIYFSIASCCCPFYPRISSVLIFQT